MNGIQIIEKEMTHVGKGLRKCERNVEKLRSALQAEEQVRQKYEKRRKQLEEARATLLTEQEKTLKAAGLTLPPTTKLPAAKVEPAA